MVETRRPGHAIGAALRRAQMERAMVVHVLELGLLERRSSEQIAGATDGPTAVRPRDGPTRIRRDLEGPVEAGFGEARCRLRLRERSVAARSSWGMPGLRVGFGYALYA